MEYAALRSVSLKSVDMCNRSYYCQPFSLAKSGKQAED